VLALCYILVGDSLQPREVSPAFAIVAVVWALATLIGPSLAGWLTALVSWRLAFVPLLLLAVAFLGLVATDRRLVETRPAAPGTIPFGRLAIIGLSIGAVSFAGARRDLLSGVLLMALALLLLGFCFRLDRVSAARLFPVREV